jgi:hypothetical protein
LNDMHEVVYENKGADNDDDRQSEDKAYHESIVVFHFATGISPAYKLVTSIINHAREVVSFPENPNHVDFYWSRNLLFYLYLILLQFD